MKITNGSKRKRKVLDPPAVGFEVPRTFDEGDDDDASEDGPVEARFDPNYKDIGLAHAVDGDMAAALAVWKRGVMFDQENFLVHDLISQAYLAMDMLLPAVTAAETVVRLAPTWSDGFVTLARAQREMGEAELALQNMQMAHTLWVQYRSAASSSLVQRQELQIEPGVASPYTSTGTDSDLAEIESEIEELRGIVCELEKRREVYLDELLRKEREQVVVMENIRNAEEGEGGMPLSVPSQGEDQGNGGENGDVQQCPNNTSGVQATAHSGSRFGRFACPTNVGADLTTTATTSAPTISNCGHSHPARQEDVEQCRLCFMHLTSRVKVAMPSSLS